MPIMKEGNNVIIIGIYTNDFRLYHDIITALKKRKIPYVSLNSLKHVPQRIKVILTSHRELHVTNSLKIIAADGYDTIDHAIDKAIQRIIGKDLYTKVYIGIDPGEKPGIAIVGDDVLLHKTQVQSPEKVLTMVRKYLNEYPSLEYLIRIGHGSILTRNRIINSLIPLKLPIEIVDETKTSSQPIKRTQRDSKAAAAIALVKGGKVQRRLPLEPTRGEIRNIQEKSRILSEGRITISQQSALEVLQGSLSLSDSIKQEIQKKRKKKTKILSSDS